MLQGVCIDSGQTTLEKGKRYFLFPNGLKHFYVSNFPNQNAHKGCFQAIYFQVIVKEDWPQEPEMVPVDLDPEKIYKANLIWRTPGYTTALFKEYFLKPMKTHTIFFRDSECKDLGGCFPLHWFEDFKEVDPDNIVTETLETVINFEESEQFPIENIHKTPNYVQLSLFDF
jgi:hypothetical protein